MQRPHKEVIRMLLVETTAAAAYQQSQHGPAAGQHDDCLYPDFMTALYCWMEQAGYLRRDPLPDGSFYHLIIETFLHTDELPPPSSPPQAETFSLAAPTAPEASARVADGENAYGTTAPYPLIYFPFGRSVAGLSPLLPPVVMLSRRTVLIPYELESLDRDVARIKLQQLYQWLAMQRDLGSDRYSDLWRTNGFPLIYASVKEMALKEMRLIKLCRLGWAKAGKYALLSGREIDHLELVYGQMLLLAVTMLDQILEVTLSFSFPVPPGGRMRALTQISSRLDLLYQDLGRWNQKVSDLVQRRKVWSKRNGRMCP